LGSLGIFQVNSLTDTQFFDALKLDKSKLIKENHNKGRHKKWAGLKIAAFWKVDIKRRNWRG
jgi:hypothetical protein